MLTEEHIQQYPILGEYAKPLSVPDREIIGREYEMKKLMASMARPEISNVLLLAAAGTGKSALVQGTAQKDTSREYLEVDLARMIANLKNGPDEMASLVKTLFNEASELALHHDVKIALFIDEFHQLVQLSSAAVEAIKPILAQSGRLGVRLLAATTYDEFHQHMSQNQPLIERFERLNLAPPPREVVVQILKNFAATHGMASEFYDDHIFQLIYEYTSRYIPESSQPRKSIFLLDGMIGWHKVTGRAMDKRLLADVLYDSKGISVSSRVDATTIEEKLNKKVFAQELAVKTLARRLQICVADLHDHSRPIMRVLFTGPTGVGKTELVKQMSKMIFNDDTRHIIRFDMSEYALDDSIDRFRLELTRQVWNTSHAILLFDEVEKAAATCTRLLLQVLDDGRLIDQNNREVSFLNTYIVATTNAGSEVYEQISRYVEEGETSETMFRDLEMLIQKSITETQDTNKFPPELLGRFDSLVPFAPLQEDTMRKIVINKLRELVEETSKKHGTRLHIDKRVVDYVVADRLKLNASSGGARQAMRILNSEVTTEVAIFVNANPGVKHASVNIEGQLVSENKNIRVSDARVVVYEGRGI